MRVRLHNKRTFIQHGNGMILGMRDNLKEEKFTVYEKVYSEDFNFILIFLCVSKFCLQQPVTKISPILPALRFLQIFPRMSRQRSCKGGDQVEESIKSLT